jgi:hypothetical protein
MKTLFKFLFALVALVAIGYAGNAEVIDPATTLLATGPALVPAITRDPATGDQVPVFTRAQKALFDYLSRKSQAQTAAALRSGALVFDPISYYIRSNITGLSGRTKILSETNSKQIGVTNFDRGLLRQYYNFCFDKITVRYTTGNSVTETVQSLAGYSSVLSSMAGGLRNGNLIIAQNQNNILDTPIIDFGAAAAVVGGGARDFDGGALQVPKILEENKQVEIWLDLAAAIPSATNTIYAVEVVLQGVQARINA